MTKSRHDEPVAPLVPSPIYKKPKKLLSMGDDSLHRRTQRPQHRLHFAPAKDLAVNHSDE
jgi:hypothetical protein